MKYIIILLIIVCAWCPWLKPEEVASLVQTKAVALVDSNPNLCTLTIDPTTISRTIFGYTEDVSYDCSTKDKVFGIAKGKSSVFVTFYKGVIGMPTHSVVK